MAFFIFRAALSERLFPERVFCVWIASLNHEARDDSMKNRPVVKPCLGQLDEVLHMLRSEVGEEFHLHFTKSGLDDGFRSRGWRRRKHYLRIDFFRTSRQHAHR